MERQSAHQKSLKQVNKAKKKPIKVVYISNPMRVKATASEFKGLVQELTGQDSNIANLSKLTVPDLAGDAAADWVSTDYFVAAAKEEQLHQQHQQEEEEGDLCRSIGNPFNKLGEVFIPQVFETLDSFLLTSPYL